MEKQFGAKMFGEVEISGVRAKVPFLEPNLCGDTDSYKLFHELMEPKDTTGGFDYFAPRSKNEMLNFFGLQPLIMHKLINNPVTKGDIEEMVDLVPRHILGGRQFVRKGWDKIVNVYGGYAPLHIRALKEGVIIPSNNAMFTVQSTDDEMAWLPGYIEPWMERMWSTVTAGTKAWRVKQLALKYLTLTCEDPDSVIDHMVHDFGCRGADSEESAALVGGAILQHFKGTDTIPALRMCAKYYAIKCAGGSVVATEHSVMGALGPEGEEEMWNGVWDTFATPGGVVSIVGDTYSIMRAVTKIVRGMRDKVMASGCRLVIRPDSSKNVEHTCQIIEDILVELAKIFGSRTNSKGCEVLKDCVRVLWGDGNNEVTLDTIMSYLMFKGWSVENMIFGIGGEWHSNQIRDTHKCAYKSSAQKREETWYDVYKDPDTDPGKVSYRGIVSTYLFGNEVATLRRSQADSPIKAHRCPPIIDLMEDVYYNGELKRFQTFDEIRELTLTPYYKAVN